MQDRTPHSNADDALPAPHAAAADQQTPIAVELQTLRESQDRALHMEGIPMLIALADERVAGPPRAAGGAADSRAAAVVAQLDHYRATLAPSQRDTDMGVIATVLTVAAYEDFDRALTP